MASKKSSIPQKSPAPTASKNSTTKTVFLSLKPEIIQQKAFEISQKGLSWNDLNWMIGEDELKISNAIEGDKKVLMGPLPSSLSINPTKIVQKPNNDEIKRMAENISQRHMALPQLHWELAIREHIINSIKE